MMMSAADPTAIPAALIPEIQPVTLPDFPEKRYLPAILPQTLKWTTF